MTDFNPRDIYERLERLGTDWANKKAIAEIAEETRKTLLAQLAYKSNESSVAAREQHALRHEDYLDHVNRMVEARREENIARVKYDAAKVWVECERTVAANERAANRSAT